MEEYNSRILQAKQAIKQADFIIIGAGSGLSTAAGLEYGGESFRNDYKEFIDKYHFEDLYSASFYDFKTQEEKWAFFAKMIKLNRYNEKPLELYQKLYEIVESKEYFILSTNVDGQFYNSGFDNDKVFEVQGDYSYLQCENACHNKLYNNKGFNTPGIIRFPFEQMTDNSSKTTLIRINKDHPLPMLEIRNKTISFCEDLNQIVGDLKE